MLAAMQVGRSVLAAGGLAATALMGFCSPPDGGGGPSEPEPVTCGRDGRGLEGVGLTSAGSLVCFDGDDPADTVDLGVVTGLENETLVGVDFRAPFTDPAGVSNNIPAEGALYGLGSNGGVYRIALDDADTATAMATKTAQLDQALAGTAFGIDFNPTVDRLRIVSDSGQNLRANVDTGVTVVDGGLNTAGAPTTGVVAAAYTNNDTDPATGTTLYDIDAALDQVVLQSPPNAGGLAPVGALGVDTGSAVGFDLYSEVRETAPGVWTTTDVLGWASLDVAGVKGLYSITPFSGRAELVGTFGVDVVDIAIPLQQ
jgi:Domain of unknown function (DUF4394)